MRLECLRDGMEDYEYFHALRRIDPDHPLLTLPEAIVTDPFDWTKTPQRLQEYRNRLAEAVENSKKDKESQ